MGDQNAAQTIGKPALLAAECGRPDLAVARGRLLGYQHEPMVLLQGLTSPWRIALESVRNYTMEADHDQV